MLTLTSIDRLHPYIPNNLEALFSDANIVFLSGSTLGRYSNSLREKFQIPSVVFHRNFEKKYYKDTDARFPMKQIHMIIGDRNQRKSWHNADISLVRTSLDRKEIDCLLYTSPSPRDATLSRMPSSA